MIGLELAQKLRDAGLKWEPQLGDWYCFGNSLPGLVDDENLEYLNQRVKFFAKKYVWLPRLDQTLTEIEWRRYLWSVGRRLMGNEYVCQLIWGGLNNLHFADTPEQAAGLALLWILQEGESR